MVHHHPQGDGAASFKNKESPDDTPLPPIDSHQLNQDPRLSHEPGMHEATPEQASVPEDPEPEPAAENGPQGQEEEETEPNKNSSFLEDFRHVGDLLPCLLRAGAMPVPDTAIYSI